jgi:hypothetical protein
MTASPEDSIILESIEFTMDEANAHLDRFRDHMIPFMPFLVLPPSLSAQDLNKERPFLLKTILAVASRDFHRQFAIKKWLLKHLADKMVVNGERNLDLLLGILTYIGWFVFHSIYSCVQ